MKIQTATGTTIETFSPDKGKVGLKALKIPGKGTAAFIAVTVICAEAYGPMYCIKKKSAIYLRYKSFMESALAD